MIIRLFKRWRNRPRIRMWLVDVVLASGETRVACSVGRDEDEALNDWLYRLSVWQHRLMLRDASGWTKYAAITSWRIRPEQEEGK